MKRTQFLLSLVALVLLSFSFSGNAQTQAIADAQHGGKFVFIKAVPVGSYEVVGKTKAKISGKIDASGLYDVGKAIIEKVEREKKGKQEKFDAFIVHKPSKIELIKFTNPDDMNNYVTSPVVKDYKKKCGTKDIYVMTKPKAKYSVVSEIAPKNFTGIGQMKMGKDEIDDFLNKIYEAACKEAKDGLDFDGIVIYDGDALVTGGLFSSQPVKLIKYE